MTRVPRVLTALALALAALLLLPLPASAAGSDVLRRLDIDIAMRPDGVLEVTETYHWDFGSRHGLGLTRVLDARFDHPPTPDQVRVYEYGDFTASSPSGAPAGVWVRDEGARVEVDIGAPDGSDDRRTGLQVYELSYTVAGALNAVRGQSGVPDQDELYWNATGHDWQVPIEQATVTVTGPADVVDHACYEGSHGSTAECASLSTDGGRVVATSGQLRPGSGVTVMAAYPPGTFDEVAPILRDRPSPVSAGGGVAGAVADFIWRNAAWSGPVALAGPVLFGIWRVRRGRDLHYADLPPGVLPPPGSRPRVVQLGRAPAVAVRFTPPDGLLPGEVGALDDKHASATHISATLIDLAVRGHLQVQEEGRDRRGRPKDWLLVDTSAAAGDDRLSPYEATLLSGLFGVRRSVRLSELRNTFHVTMRTVRRRLGQSLDGRELFVRPLEPVRNLRTVLPRLVGGVAVAYVVIGGASSVDSLAAAFLVLVGVLLAVAFTVAAAVTARARRQRTATGRALHEQSRGFARYLATAEAEQLRFEEGEDIFSRYLPYAIVYGVAERWARVFAELEARGARVARPTWYVGSDPSDLHSSSVGDLGRSLSRFSSTTRSTLSSTPGSSGRSGSRSSGGGGGFSGGGGGGGGGRGR